MTTPKRPRDPNQLAKFIVDVATGEAEEREVVARKDVTPAEHGRRGGLVGGEKRSAALSQQKRSEIARKAAQTRWRKDPTAV